jgi:hypothetical protein
LFPSQTFAINMQIKTAITAFLAHSVGLASAGGYLTTYWDSDDCTGDVNHADGPFKDGECRKQSWGGQMFICHNSSGTMESAQYGFGGDPTCSRVANAKWVPGTDDFNKCAKLSTGSSMSTCVPMTTSS